VREIGGYLSLDRYQNEHIHDKAIALNSGRNCLAYLIQKKEIKKIYLPKFLCASVGDICRKYGVEIVYYSIGSDLLPVENEFSDGWLYLVNYYGQISNKKILELKKAYSNLIVDNIQAYFQKPCTGIDTIYTCRKFFGVTDGAFLYSDIELDETLEVDCSWSRMEHIVGSFECGASAFYSNYQSSEEDFENMPVRTMSRLTDNLLRGIDYNVVEEKRTENFRYLHSKLSDLNKLNLTVPDGPYMYPLYINGGAEIRKELQKIKIFIPTLWPDVFDLCTEDELEYEMAQNILPIPIDQRYGTEDMEYIITQVLAVIDRLHV